MPAQATSMEFFPWTDFGSPFTEPTYVEVTVTGLLAAYYGPNEVRFGESAGEFWQNLDARGWYDTSTGSCGAGVKVGFTQSGGVNFCIENNAEPVLSARSITAIVKGQPRMWRNKGPWLAGCNDAADNPCFVLTGSQTITVVPKADKLQLVASATEVAVGESVTFTASTADGAAFTIREWNWVSDAPGVPNVIRRGSEPGAVSIKVVRGQNATRPSFDGTATLPSCVITSATCTITVSEAGTMYVKAWVVSKIEQASAHVGILPPELIVYCSAPPANIQNSGSLVRGSDVTCVGRLSEAKAFEIVGISASAGGNVYQLPSTDARYKAYQAGDSVEWSGRAVVTTTVEMMAALSESGQSIAGTGEFTVTPRAWTSLVVPQQPSGTATTQAPPLSRTFPLIDSAGFDVQSYPGALGVNGLGYRPPHPQYTGAGPNAGWWYVGRPPELSDYTIHYSAWLDDSSAFALRQREQQSGEPTPLRYPQYCESFDVTLLRQSVLRHEGAQGTAGESHHTVNEQFVNGSNAVQQVEGYVLFLPVPDDSAQTIEISRRAIQQTRDYWDGVYSTPLKEAQAAFDTANPVVLPRCKFRY